MCVRVRARARVHACVLGMPIKFQTDFYTYLIYISPYYFTDRFHLKRFTPQALINLALLAAAWHRHGEG